MIRLPVAVERSVVSEPPGYAVGARVLRSLRERRRVRRVMTDLYEGRWRRVLIDLRTTQQMFRPMRRHDGAVGELLVKLNAINLAADMHATVAVGDGPRVSVQDGLDEHRAAIAAVEERVRMATFAHRAIRRANVRSEAVVMAEVEQGHSGPGAVIRMLPNDEAFPVGPCTADGQCTVWERRWVTEREFDRGSMVSFLRIERHRVDDRGVGVVEQEAYVTPHSDVLVDAAGLVRVRVDTASPSLAGRHDRVVTGVAMPLVSRIVCDIDDDDQPAFLIPEADIDLLDAMAASFSRLDRVMTMHAAPKLKVDALRGDGEVGLSDADVLIDPENRISYLQAEANLESLMSALERYMGWVFVQLQISPALLGIRFNGGATPDSAEKLRIESTNTLARAMQTAAFAAPGLSHALRLAGEVEARLPGRGHATGAITVDMHPSLPKDRAQLADELRAMLDASRPLIGHRSALEALYGPRRADAAMAEIEGDLERSSARQQAALGLDLATPAIPPEADPSAVPSTAGRSRMSAAGVQLLRELASDVLLGRLTASAAVALARLSLPEVSEEDIRTVFTGLTRGEGVAA